MVLQLQTPMQHPAGALALGSNSTDERGCSRQQIAAAWAWFERSGAPCTITPHRTEAFRGARPQGRPAGRPPSRFKQEFLALAIEHAAVRNLESSVSTPPRRHSFHGKSMRRQSTKSCGDMSLHTASARWFPALSQDVDDLPNGCDTAGDRLSGCSLLDEFELVSVWQQVQRNISPAVIANVADCSGAATNPAAKAVDCSGAAAEIPAKSATYENGKQSPLYSSHRKWGAAFMRRGGSGHFDGGHPPGKAHHRQRSGAASPDFLRQLLRLHSGKSLAGSPTLCSSIATADSIRKHRLLLPYSSNKPKQHHKHNQAKILNEDLSSMQKNYVDVDRMHSTRVEALQGDDGEEELDHHHFFHRHRHVHHHHHHHHHHVLQYPTGLLHEDIMSKDDGFKKGAHGASRHRLYIESTRNSGHYDYGCLEKNEYSLQPPYLDHKRPPSLFF